MGKNIYYKYNPVTDSFERFFPSFKTRLFSLLRLLGVGTAIGVGMFFIIFFAFDSPTERHLRAENSELRSQYNILERRLNNALDVMSDIQQRDDNLYRVVMQLDPVSRNRRLAGLDNDSRYRNIRKLSDAELLTTITRQMDLLDRQLYTQSLSFDQLTTEVKDERNKFLHIPSILPIRNGARALTGGFGNRRDPISGKTKFHPGVDFAVPEGIPVYATADGQIVAAQRKEDYGNCVEIDHGYNYLTRYASLSRIAVEKGHRVKGGDLIGYAGTSGRSIEPHLHYEVRFKGEAQNPVNYFFRSVNSDQYTELLRATENAAAVMD